MSRYIDVDEEIRKINEAIFKKNVTERLTSLPHIVSRCLQTLCQKHLPLMLKKSDTESGFR